MPTYLEMWSAAGPQLVPLTGERLTLGSDTSNDLAIRTDRTVSRLHAAFVRYPGGWSVRDLGSRNGTHVNGQRLWHEQALRDGDEIRTGAARFVYRVGEPSAAVPATDASGSPLPELTRRERAVLVQLCRPMLEGDPFTEPASTRTIAEALVVTEGAVKQHLVNLYHKFGISEDGERRRLRLANEAVRREAVTYADLRAADG